jgi:L-fuconolactonase
MHETTKQTLKPRHIPVREDWLALRTESPIEPERPIIDAHHHLWDKPGSRYLLDEMVADMAGHSIVATVFAEGKEGYRSEGPPHLKSLGETELVTAIAEASLERSDGRLHMNCGIVGYVDMLLGDAAGEVLDRHIEAAKRRFRGVRNATAWHADPSARGSVLAPPAGLSYEPEFRRGLSQLAKRGLVFDAWAYHTQLGELVDLAHAMPELSIVINHQGGPIGIGPYEGRRQEVFEDWRYFMRKLARYENVSVKLGGFGMLMAGFDFQDRDLPPTSEELAEVWGPYHVECVETFGPSRCMFESNFPVDKGTCSYLVLWNAFKRIAMDYSADEKHALFFGTANRIYSLGLDSGAERHGQP